MQTKPTDHEFKYSTVRQQKKEANQEEFWCFNYQPVNLVDPDYETLLKNICDAIQYAGSIYNYEGQVVIMFHVDYSGVKEPVCFKMKVMTWLDGSAGVTLSVLGKDLVFSQNIKYITPEHHRENFKSFLTSISKSHEDDLKTARRLESCLSMLDWEI